MTVSINNLLRRVAKLEANKGGNSVQFRSFAGELFSIPKKRVVDVYYSIFNGEVSKENTAVLASDVVTPGEGCITTLLRMMQE